MASGTINATSVNLRESPDPSANVVAILIRDTTVATLLASGDWLMVSAKVDDVAHVGWVQSQFVSAGATAPSPPSGGNPPSQPPSGTLLRGDGSFAFTAEVVGDDIEVHGVTATWFGGPDDTSDNGTTASGLSTRDDPELIGCALPMDRAGSPKTDGSPIPKLPYLSTIVSVSNLANDAQLDVKLIDLGPSKLAASQAAIDLTEAAFKALGGNPQDGVMRVNYTIPGAARRLPASAGGVSLAQSENDPATSHELGGGDDAHGQSHGVQKPAVTFIRSPNFSSRNGTPIDMIVMHFTDGGSAQGAINRFQTPSEQVSAHYIIERDGHIFQMVEDAQEAWHAKASNPRSIGIEHVALPEQGMTDDQEAASSALVRWLVATYRIKPANILGHRFAPGNEGTTDCPSHLFGAASKQAVADWVTDNIVTSSTGA